MVLPEVVALYEESVIRDTKTFCWSWRGRRYKGYGLIEFDGRNYLIHRVSYEIANGLIPPGAIIRHLCHHKLCSNPDHLAHGSHYDNAIDNILVRRDARPKYQIPYILRHMKKQRDRRWNKQIWARRQVKREIESYQAYVSRLRWLELRLNACLLRLVEKYPKEALEGLPA